MATLSRAVSTMTLKPVMELANDALSGQSISPTALIPDDVTYDSTSTPLGTRYVGQTETITGSSNTIDLTDLVDPEGVAVTGSELKVQEFRVSAPSTNTAVIVVGGGDADPYELFGSGKTIDVVPGGNYQFRFDDELDDILTGTGAGETDIKFAGTTGDVYTYEFIMG